MASRTTIMVLPLLLLYLSGVASTVQTVNVSCELLTVVTDTLDATRFADYLESCRHPRHWVSDL